jgi:hypothetical protein
MDAFLRMFDFDYWVIAVLAVVFLALIGVFLYLRSRRPED